jgi:hypothetical protein
MDTVILFKTTNDVMVHVHDAKCPLVDAARKSRGLIRVIPHTEDNVRDFQERGWKVKHCKCSKTPERA